MAEVTLDLLAAAIAELESANNNSGGQTLSEIRNERGWSVEKTRQVLRYAQSRGCLANGRRSVTSISGKPAYVPTYRVIPAAADAEKPVKPRRRR